MKKKTKKLIFKISYMTFAVVVITAIALATYLTRNEFVSDIRPWVMNAGTTYTDETSLTKLAVSILYDNYEGGACSAAVKTVPNGDTIVGRNMDMTLSNKPVYIGNTHIDGYYETFYASYLGGVGPDYTDCIVSGVPRYLLKLLPFTALDSLNSEGLYIQINMREDQKDENGNNVFQCSHTNENANIRISAIELPTYVTLRCKNVNEAVALIKSLDIYTLGDDIDWTFSYILADAEGNYGLLELGCNEVRWLPGQAVQTNFYVSDDLAAIQKYKQGIGRYDYLEANLGRVTTEWSMGALLQNVRYSKLYDLENAGFDMRSEFAGDFDYLTNEYLDNDDNWNACKVQMLKEADIYNSLNEKGRRDADYYWNTLYTAVVNCSEKNISLYFSEDYSAPYTFDFSAVSVVRSDEYTNTVIALEVLSLIISLIMLYGNTYESKRTIGDRTRRQKIFSLLVITNIIGTTADMLSWIFDGNMQCQPFVNFVTILAMAMTYVIIGIFSMYMYTLLKERTEVNINTFKLFGQACIVAIAVTVILYLTAGFYTIKDGEFYENDLYPFYSGMSGVFIAVTISIATHYRKIFGVHDFIAILSYGTIPVLAAMVAFLIPEISLGYPAAAIAMLTIYVMLQSETVGKLSDEKTYSEYAANHDIMTGLLSRRAYVDALDTIARDRETMVGVLFADINGLKFTNDRFGHSSGDELIRKFAEKSKNYFLDECIYRISGDEFVIMVPGINKGFFDSQTKRFRKDLDADEISLACLGCEFGSSKRINELITIAENQMYADKQEFYKEHPEMKR